MNDSLSIIVPIRNQEAGLTEQVHQLLETLPDLTSRFEILLIDDASADHTAEVAADLARQYPQVRLFRHQESLGRDAAIQTGVSRALGQTLLVQDGGEHLSPTDLRRLWSLRHDRQIVMARSQQPGTLDPALVERLCTWGQTLRSLARGKLAGGLQMIRRDMAEKAVSQPSAAGSRQARPNNARYTTVPTARP